MPCKTDYYPQCHVKRIVTHKQHIIFLVMNNAHFSFINVNTRIVNCLQLWFYLFYSHNPFSYYNPCYPWVLAKQEPLFIPKPTQSIQLSTMHRVFVFQLNHFQKPALCHYPAIPILQKKEACKMVELVVIDVLTSSSHTKPRKGFTLLSVMWICIRI